MWNESTADAKWLLTRNIWGCQARVPRVIQGVALGLEGGRLEVLGTLRPDPCPQEQPGLPAPEVRTRENQFVLGQHSVLSPVCQSWCCIIAPAAARAGCRASGPPVPGGLTDSLTGASSLYAGPWDPQSQAANAGGLSSPADGGLCSSRFLRAAPFWVPQGPSTVSGTPPLAWQINKLLCVSSVLSEKRELSPEG